MFFYRTDWLHGFNARRAATLMYLYTFQRKRRGRSNSGRSGSGDFLEKSSKYNIPKIIIMTIRRIQSGQCLRRRCRPRRRQRTLRGLEKHSFRDASTMAAPFKVNWFRALLPPTGRVRFTLFIFGDFQPRPVVHEGFAAAPQSVFTLQNNNNNNIISPSEHLCLAAFRYDCIIIIIIRDLHIL